MARAAADMVNAEARKLSLAVTPMADRKQMEKTRNSSWSEASTGRKARFSNWLVRTIPRTKTATSVEALDALDAPMNNVGNKTRTRKKSRIELGLESWRSLGRLRMICNSRTRIIRPFPKWRDIVCQGGISSMAR